MIFLFFFAFLNNYSYSKQTPLKFNNNHEFTILQFTDLHYGKDNIRNIKTTELQKKLINFIKPDLVVISGDMVNGYEYTSWDYNFYYTYWSQATQPYKETQQYYAYVFGNHDTQSDISPEEILKLERTNEFSLFDGTKEIDNISFSNYVLKVQSGFEDQKKENSLLVFLLDTQSKGCLWDIKSYGCLNQKQIDWVEKQIETNKNKNGEVLNSIAFFHIPTPEFMEVYRQGKTRGIKGETVGCPTINTRVLNQLKKHDSFIAMFCGHDHASDYGGEFMGVGLYYCRKTGFGSYSNQELLKGGRVIQLKEKVDGDRIRVSYDTYIIQENLSPKRYNRPIWQGLDDDQKYCDFE